jgi:RHS repeat-associated protein
MRIRTLLRFLLISSSFFALASQSFAQTIKLVQHGTTDNGATSTTTVVLTLNGVAAGDLLTCSLSFGAASAVSLSVADNVNGAWSVANTAHFDSASTQVTGQFYLANSKAGTTTITGTVGTANADGAINCQEWSGAATSNPLDQATQQDGTAANASSGNVTTAVVGELILGDLENIGSPTAGSGFTLLNSTPYTEISTEYQVQATAGALAATWTSSAGNWTAQVATFKPAPVPGSINLIQHGTTDNGGSSSTVALTLNGVTAGDLLTCSLSFGASSAITLSVADNVNGAWSVANAAHFDSANTQATGQFYFANSKPGNITITGTAGTAGAPQAINCQEWSGVATSSPLDQVTQQDGTAANASSGNVTTAVVGELILGDLENIGSPTAGSGFTLINTTAQTWLSTEYQVQTSAGAIAATWTSSAGNWTAQVATFKPASGGGGAPPTITSFSPPSGVIGTSVTITGTNFTGATSTKFNGTTATSFTVNSSTQISATVPTGATSGNISVTTPYGTATSSTSFTVTTPPTITNFVPLNEPPGTDVTITGTNFTGATAVDFGGVAAASFTVNGSTQITAKIPSNAANGPISVTTPSGTATSSASFTVDLPPTVTSFTPVSGTIGTLVTITGTNFNSVNGVAFGKQGITSGNVISSTQITATVPSNATTGPISVLTSYGTAISSASFTVNAPTVYYYIEDSLGSARVIATSSGVVCYDADFYPYGGERPVTDSCPSNYKFEGKERDTETGNDDFGARYYSNRFGRWLSADWSAVPVAVPYANLSNPQTLNLYAMVSDDPESFADLDGHCCDGDGVGDTIGRFFATALATWASDNAGGAFRPDATTVEGKLGQMVGDFAAQQTGMAEVGTATDLTPGALALASGGQEEALAVPGVLALHGAVTAGIGTTNLAKNALEDTATSKPHGNTAGDQPAELYEKHDANGNFEKHGVSQDASKRYSKKEVNGGTVKVTERGPRKEMLKKERQKVETNPGPKNKEPWAGKKKASNQ